jgi:hypothetical protein
MSLRAYPPSISLKPDRITAPDKAHLARLGLLFTLHFT